MIIKRKEEHIKICLEEKVEAGHTGFEELALEPKIPTIKKEDISLSTKFLGHSFRYPFFVCGITGGCPAGRKINANIAAAVQGLGIGMGVGSQRAALEDPSLEDSFSIVRRRAPDAYLVGNIGAVQLKEYGVKEVAHAVDMIRADAMAVHFNGVQEAVQPEGDTDFTGVFSNLKNLCSSLKVPVIAKETGSGFSQEDATNLKDAGVSAIDIGGWGGTNFALVEHYRSKSGQGKLFSNWGIPTYDSLIQCKGILPLIASGGIRSGIDAAKALSAGADLVGFALPVLKPAQESAAAVSKTILRLAEELRVAMFLTNTKSVSKL